MKIRLATIGLIGCAVAFGNGCGWEQPKAASRLTVDPSHAMVLHVPAKELVKISQEVLPLPPLLIPVESVKDGTIFTDWKEYEGAIHIARRWRERTRFRIDILPDFNDPTGTSHLQIFDETEEKPSEPQPWYPNPDLQRPERSAEIVKAIEDRASKKQ